ncbi:hypothetical protein DL96DRAFT_395910 [Flagelloscypha sp. PMI_526]|nr:hypothetical protein DL96DRAFT_395910 [Flagelloscypha sp. PMI_526]
MASPEAQPSPKMGYRLLAFDGGGLRAISQALIVRDMLQRLEEDNQLSHPARVCDYFDMICGSGLGGHHVWYPAHDGRSTRPRIRGLMPSCILQPAGYHAENIKA